MRWIVNASGSAPSAAAPAANIFRYVAYTLRKSLGNAGASTTIVSPYIGSRVRSGQASRFGSWTIVA